ncbi:MAG TPA: hypothetical protein VGV08_01225 [Casimicrobiaceae bacterium]|nr:hypothetical protein [Casimicrobiaceae bacterium]
MQRAIRRAALTVLELAPPDIACCALRAGYDLVALRLPGRRGPLRHCAYLSPAATGVMAGCGVAGCDLGIASPVRFSEGRA